jgi:hypothetical protein
MDDGSLLSHCSPTLTRGAHRVKYGSAQRLIEFQRVEDADDEVARPPARPARRARGTGSHQERAAAGADGAAPAVSWQIVDERSLASLRVSPERLAAISELKVPPPPPPFVLTGHAASFTPH